MIERIGYIVAMLSSQVSDEVSRLWLICQEWYLDVIILIDSNIFIADPHCKGIAWRALAHAAPAWGLRLATTEVVVAEVVGKYERVIDARERELTKLSRALSQLGLDQVLARPMAMIVAAKGAYSSGFGKMLESLSIEIIVVPDIPHMDLVRRATSRRRPCDDNGDGYRDTLNWLILLRTAEDNPTEQIAWISDDTDFMNGSGFHSDLIDDLTAIGASDRVLLYRGVKDLVLKLAAEKGAGDDLRSLADQLQRRAISDYLTTEIIPAAFNSPLNAYRCGLPLGTKDARLLGITDVADVGIELTGSISGDQVLAQFILKATATIEISDDADKPELDASANLAVSPTETPTSKPLLFCGIITLDAQGKPLTAELSTIEAEEDDPGRKRWDEALALSETLGNHAVYLNGLALPSIPENYVANIVLPSLPADFFKNIVLPSIPEDLFGKLVLGSGYAKRASDEPADDEDGRSPSDNLDEDDSSPEDGDGG